MNDHRAAVADGEAGGLRPYQAEAVALVAAGLRDGGAGRLRTAVSPCAMTVPRRDVLVTGGVLGAVACALAAVLAVAGCGAQPRVLAPERPGGTTVRMACSHPGTTTQREDS